MDKEDKEVTKQDIEQIVSAAIEKAIGTSTQQSAIQKAQNSTEVVEKTEGKSATTTEITPESVEKMVEEAITKALEPQQEAQVTIEQVQEMITTAVTKAIDPVLKSKGLPSNLNGSIEKSAGDTHYLHGIL